MNGHLKLNSLKSIVKKQDKIFKKIEKSKKIQKLLKSKGIELPDKMISKKHINLIKKNQNTGVFWKGNTLVMEIWDNGKIDGDILDLFVDRKMVLKNYRISSHVKTLKIPLEKKRTKIKIVSKNEGETPQTTASIKLIDGENTNEILTSLSLYEKSIITILK